METADTMAASARGLCIKPALGTISAQSGAIERATAVFTAWEPS